MSISGPTAIRSNLQGPSFIIDTLEARANREFEALSPGQKAVVGDFKKRLSAQHETAVAAAARKMLEPGYPIRSRFFGTGPRDNESNPILSYTVPIADLLARARNVDHGEIGNTRCTADGQLAHALEAIAEYNLAAAGFEPRDRTVPGDRGRDILVEGKERAQAGLREIWISVKR